MTPTKPASFHYELAPVGVEVLFYSLWRERPLMPTPPRLAVVHTNAANGEGSVESAANWSERNTWGDGKSYTIPHYQVDRDGRARKMLPTNRRGIANSTGNSVEHENTLSPEGYRDSSWFAIAIETADTGTLDDPTISAFTPEQIERIAEILAYESLVPGSEIVLELPEDWYCPGCCAHTHPWPYPYLTTVPGKTCPGPKKKAQMPAILARARAIAAAWTAPTPTPKPTPPEDDDMARIYLARSTVNKYELRRGDGNISTVLRSNEQAHAAALFSLDREPNWYNPLTGQRIATWQEIPELNETQLDLWVGYPAYSFTLPDEG